MHSTVRRRTRACAVPLLAALLSWGPAAHAAVTPAAHWTEARVCAGGWQLRISVRECALRMAGAALAGAVLPLPFAVPVTLGLAAGALFTCF